MNILRIKSFEVFYYRISPIRLR